jgi:predicted GIY-YIG superfamily endonuclease
MYYVYMLRLDKGELYGMSKNLLQRTNDHQSGKVITTSKSSLRKLVWYGAFETQELAKDFEIYLKSNSGHALRNKRLVRLSRKN